MADLKISQLNSLAGSSLANNDVLAVVDTSASETKKITSKDLVQYGYALVDPNTLDGNVIEPGTTSARGTVQLTDSTSSTSTTTAATPNAVKGAFDLANAALPKSGGTMTGQILGDDSTSASTPGYAFDGDPDTGLLRTGANELGLVTGGTARLTIDASGNVIVPGNFTVQGTTTTIDTTTLVVEDKNIEMGAVATPSDVTADGGGITLRGTTDKTINWIDATDAWTSSERFSVPTGTAGAPSLTFTGDPNTGIYSPGADQVAISTGGSGRLFVDASGNVGVGTSSIGGTFQVFKSSGAEALINQSTASSYARLKFANDSTNTLELISRGSTATGGLSLTAPGELLTRGATPLAILTESTQPVVFGTNNAERLRITSAGLVGVGTSAPGYKVEIAGTSGSAVLGLLETGVRSWGIRAGGALTNTFDIADFTAGVTRLTIDSSGRVGIGSSTPGNLLELGGQGSPKLGINSNTSGSAIPGVLFQGNGTTYGSINQNISSGELSIKSGASGQTSYFITFGTNDGTERARIDSSGRLLVGTSSARSNFYNSTVDSRFLLESNSVASGERILANVHNSATANGPILLLAKSRSTSIGGNTVVADGDALGTIDFQGNDGSEFVRSARIQAEVDGTPAADSMPGRIVLSTTASGASSPTERMRIRNNGSTGIFHTASGAGGAVLELNSSATAGTTDYLFWATNSATGTFTGTVCLRAFTNGNVQNTNNSYGAISDAKLKENIIDATSQWSDIKALQVRKYNFKEGQTHTQIGLVAQEVELVSPGLVTESPDRDAEGNDLGTVTKSVNYSVLYMKAVKALQEAMERIEQLETSNADLLARVTALESA